MPTTCARASEMCCSYTPAQWVASCSQWAAGEKMCHLPSPGVRCVEIDCWDGADGACTVTHGGTLCGHVSFVDVVAAVAKHAFAHGSTLPVRGVRSHRHQTSTRARARLLLRARLNDWWWSCPRARIRLERCVGFVDNRMCV